MFADDTMTGQSADESQQRSHKPPLPGKPRRNGTRAVLAARPGNGQGVPGLLSRTPAPPPFSGMNSIPAASRAARIAAKVRG